MDKYVSVVLTQIYNIPSEFIDRQIDYQKRACRTVIRPTEKIDVMLRSYIIMSTISIWRFTTVIPQLLK